MWGAGELQLTEIFGVMPCQSGRDINVCVYVMALSWLAVSALISGIYFQGWKQEDTSMHRDIVSSCWDPFSYLIAQRAYEVLCAVPLVSDLPDVVIYERHSDSCVLSCSHDVARDWISLVSNVDNQFNIAYLEFFILQRVNQTKALTWRLHASALIIFKLWNTVQTLYMSLIITCRKQCHGENIWSYKNRRWLLED
jgi:hypothetical protein